MEKLGWWLPAQWAVFRIIYAIFVRELNKKLWLNFKVTVNYITTLSKKDTKTYGIWMPRYNKKLAQAMLDGTVTTKEIKQVDDYEWKTFWHNLIWDWSKGWYIINTDWSKPAKCSIDTLKYWVSLWVFWDTLRTIEHATEETRQVISLTRSMAIAEMNWKLELYLKTNKDNIHLEKAKKLFYYWRDDI